MSPYDLQSRKCFEHFMEAITECVVEYIDDNASTDMEALELAKAAAMACVAAGMTQAATLGDLDATMLGPMGASMAKAMTEGRFMLHMVKLGPDGKPDFGTDEPPFYPTLDPEDDDE